jgi:flagellar hook-associated protein 2
MSTQSISATGGTNGAPVQIQGLASGLNTSQIITQLMSLDQAPITNLTNQQNALTGINNTLTSIQSGLQGLVSDAQALGDPSLYALTQTITSGNSALVSATATSSTGVGAVTGGYSIAVSQLATSSQQAFTYTSQAAANTITIDGNSYNLAANATSQDLANAVNNDPNGTVWAAVTNASTGAVVFSSRTTGAATSFNASGNTGLVASGGQQAGQDALYSINGGATQNSASNTLTSAIPGVSLTLNGVNGVSSGGYTTSNNPVTVTVGSPAPSASAIQSAITQFVKDYNSVVSTIQGQTNTQPSSSADPSLPTLFGDLQLGSLLNSMRTAMYTPGAGLPTGMASLADLGISTGAASGSGTPSQDSINGMLTVNTATLTAALQNNPNGVKAVLQSFAQSFSSLVNNVAAPGGTLDSRIQGDSAEISDMSNRITSMNAALAVKQQTLQNEFNAMEVAMSNSQSQSSWLTGQVASLSANSSTSKS